MRVKVLRGQCGHGAVALSKRWKWPRGKVIRFLKELECDSRIVQQKNNVTTLISILKYEEYQSQQNSKRAASRTANGQQTDINNNDNNDNNGNKSQKHSRFTPPSLTELNEYANNKSLVMDISAFIDFYQSKNWMVGKNKMKDWKASARNWARRNNNNGDKDYGKRTDTRNRAERCFDAIRNLPDN